MLQCTKSKGYGGNSSLEEQRQSDQKVVSLVWIRWGCTSECIFACGARGSKCNHEYVKDSSLDTVGESSADPVPLRNFVEGLHYSKMQTSELQEQISSWSLISGVVRSIFDLGVGFVQQDHWCTPFQCFNRENFGSFKKGLIPPLSFSWSFL